MKLIFLSTFIFLIASCGSRDIQYNEFNDTVLDNLRKKAQTQCLLSKGSIIQSWKDQWEDFFESNSILKENRRFSFVYNIDDDGKDPTHTIRIDVSNLAPDQTSITLVAVNENSNDNDENDSVEITYTKELHDDHVQLLIAEACSAENPTITNDQIIYEIDSLNKTDRYELTSQYPAIFARYLSFTKEVRTGGTTENRGTVSKAITLTSPTFQDLSSSTISSNNCNLQPISFDDNADSPGPPTLSTSSIISSLGIREENGMDSCP